MELAISINTDAVIKGVLIFAEQLFESSESRSVGYSPLLSALYSLLWRGSFSSIIKARCHALRLSGALP